MFEDYSIAELIDYIDWTPFFSTWELTGKFPAILDDDKFGEAARSLYDDARAMLKKIVDENWFKAAAVIGFWPANASGDDIELYADDTRASEAHVLHTLRQQLARREGRPNMALADFVAPRESKLQDYIGAFVVTAGIGEDVIADRFKLRQRRLFVDPGQGAGRPSGRSLRRAHASARAQGVLGLRGGRDVGDPGSDRREISRHPPGARLSGAARPHREGDAVPPARCRTAPA